MRDPQVEERLRAVLRAEGDALPLTITTAELDRRLALRRRERRGRAFSLAAAAIAVVAVGSLVASTSGWFGADGVGTGPSAMPSPTPVNSPAVLPCDTIHPGTQAEPPALILGLSPGDSIAHQGAVTEFVIGNAHARPFSDWSQLVSFEVDRSVRLQALAANPDVCITELVVTYARGEPGEVRPPTFSPGGISIPVAEPTRVVEFAPPEDAGEWFVRVKATFAIDPPAEAWTEAVFRIAVPDPAPFDDSVLGAFPYLAAPPATILLDEMSGTREVTQPTGAVEAAIAGQVPPRSIYIIHVACLGPSPIRWSIGLEQQHDFLVAEDQSCDGTIKELGVERGTPRSPLPVIVNADPATVWRIRIATTEPEPLFLPPALRMIETGNTEGSTGAVEAFGRCVSVASATAACGGEWHDLEGARSVTVPRLARLTLGLEDGWTIDEARLTAVSRDLVAQDAFAPEHSVAFVEDGGPLVTVQVPLDPGAWIVRVALDGSRNGETFGAHYDLLVVVGE